MNRSLQRKHSDTVSKKARAYQRTANNALTQHAVIEIRKRLDHIVIVSLPL